MSDTDKVKVLVADDEGIARKIIKKTVESMGFEVVAEAKNGEEAINLYKQFKPDILLLDLDMPDKTGETVLKEVIGEYPDALIIMVTAHKDKNVLGDCFGLGAKDYISKDATREETISTIRKTWEKRVA